MLSPSPVPLSTDGQGQCACSKQCSHLETHLKMSSLKRKARRKEMLNLSRTHQTPREIPSSDVKYMLMVWLRETSAGWLRSTKNGSLTTNQKRWELGWTTGGFTELPTGTKEIYLRLWVKTRCWIKSGVLSKKGAKTKIRQRPKPVFSHHRDLRT